MATSKALRAAPPKILDNYVASIAYGPPESVNDNTFSESDYATQGSTVEALITPSDYANAFTSTGKFYDSLGFEVNLNGIIYNRFTFTEHGWLNLIPKTFTNTFSSLYWTTTVSNPTFNGSIKYFFSDLFILIAPWFDYSVAVPSSVDVLAAATPYSSLSLITDSISLDIRQGRNTKNWPYDEKDRGVRSKIFSDSQRGRYRLIRWTNSQYANSGIRFNNKLKFEVAIFESGRIEFRYWPLENYESPNSSTLNSSATVGVFWRSFATSAYSFRDFAPLLGYSLGQRTLNPFGGSNDLAYSESSDPQSNLITQNYWPKNGATITFSPPVNPAKFLPRKIAQDIGNSRSLEPEAGAFDDRKTLGYTAESNQETVHMPSTLARRLAGDGSSAIDMSLRQILFPQNGITMSGRQSRDAAEGMISQISVAERLGRRADMSFNEAAQDYGTTTNTSVFYQSGSSFEVGEDKFTYPLRSKTKFSVSLPITKQVSMPATTSSFYWYNKDRKSWDSYGEPARIKMTYVNYDGPIEDAVYPPATNPYGEQDEEWFWVEDNLMWYKVTETAIGFDATGRKIVSGSYPDNEAFYFGSDETGTLQSDPLIGTVLNTVGHKTPLACRDQANLASGTMGLQVVSKAIAKEYENSLTDNPRLFPGSNCQFSIGNDQPFLIEKIVVKLPLSASGGWFRDYTTCNKAYIAQVAAEQLTAYPAYDPQGYAAGPIDFGGPGITVALHCPRKYLGASFLDLVASGTITHEFDNKKETLFRIEPGTNYYCMRPEGFLSFSNPTTVVSGTWDGVQHSFVGDVSLQMTPAVAGGVSISRNTIPFYSTTFSNNYARDIAENLLNSKQIFTFGETLFGPGDGYGPSELADWVHLARPDLRVYLHQISPLSRGTSRFKFNGNSIIGGVIGQFNCSPRVDNPLYVSGTLPAHISTALGSTKVTIDNELETICLYSKIDVTESPYLLMPGEKLSLSISKTRPVVYKLYPNETTLSPGLNPEKYAYDAYALTGSHNSVVLTTGSIDITVYGSYVKEGAEYQS